MAANKEFIIEVAYAKADEQCVLKIKVEQGCTIAAVINSSGILKLYPEIKLEKNKVGIFSKQKELDDEVKEGDRVEIYRPLTIDPKEARRKRAKK